VIDDIDSLFGLQASGADSRAEPSPPLATNSIRLPLFRPGTRVSYQGNPCTVSHVMISRSQLLVHLHETGSAVHADELVLEPTRLPLRRN
jgi:hypothetical protein